MRWRSLEFPVDNSSTKSHLETRLKLPDPMSTGKRESPCTFPTFFQDANLLLYSPMSQEDVRWNWEKILFDKNGQPFRRYASMVEPFEIEEDIITLLAQ